MQKWKNSCNVLNYRPFQHCQFFYVFLSLFIWNCFILSFNFIDWIYGIRTASGQPCSFVLIGGEKIWRSTDWVSVVSPKLWIWHFVARFQKIIEIDKSCFINSFQFFFIIMRKQNKWILITSFEYYISWCLVFYHSPKFGKLLCFSFIFIVTLS